jgi:hypothetical protein
MAASSDLPPREKKLMRNVIRFLDREFLSFKPEKPSDDEH